MRSLLFLLALLALPYSLQAAPLDLESWFQFDHYQRTETDLSCHVELKKSPLELQGDYKLLPSESCRHLSLTLVKGPQDQLAVQMETRYPENEKYSSLSFQYTLKDGKKQIESGLSSFPTKNFSPETRLIYVQKEDLGKSEIILKIPCSRITRFTVSGNLGGRISRFTLRVQLDSEKITALSLPWVVWETFSKNYSDLEKRQVRFNDSILIDTVSTPVSFNSCDGEPLPQL